jgi:hypothetical protein
MTRVRIRRGVITAPKANRPETPEGHECTFGSLEIGDLFYFDGMQVGLQVHAMFIKVSGTEACLVKKTRPDKSAVLGFHNIWKVEHLPKRTTFNKLKIGEYFDVGPQMSNVVFKKTDKRLYEVLNGNKDAITYNIFENEMQTVVSRVVE